MYIYRHWTIRLQVRIKYIHTYIHTNKQPNLCALLTQKYAGCGMTEISHGWRGRMQTVDSLCHGNSRHFGYEFAQLTQEVRGGWWNGHPPVEQEEERERGMETWQSLETGLEWNQWKVSIFRVHDVWVVGNVTTQGLWQLTPGSEGRDIDETEEGNPTVTLHSDWGNYPKHKFFTFFPCIALLYLGLKASQGRRSG